MNKQHNVNRYEWDLEFLLQGNSLETLINEVKHLFNWFVKNINQFYLKKTNFVKWLNNELILDRKINRLINYVSNNYNVDLTNEKWNIYMQKINNIFHQYNIKMSALNNIIIKNKNKINSYLVGKLAKYKYYFNQIWRNEKHILNDETERRISMLASDSDSINDMFTTLIDSEMLIEDAKDAHGKMHKIRNDADLNQILQQDDRTLRKNAWINYLTAFYDKKNTLTKMLYYNYLRENSWAKAKNFQGYIDRTLFNDEIDKSFLLNLYKNVSNYRDLFYLFEKNKKKILLNELNIKNVEPWDKNVNYLKLPIVSIEQVKKIVLEALLPLGDNYINVVNKAFNECWISWLPTKNKLSGAYSIGNIYGLGRYYILMNFDGTYDSISTIIHELGHSVNSYFINKSQDIYCSTKIFYAEIPSIVNECLLMFYLMKKYKKNNKKYYLYFIGELLSGFFNATTRQIIFSNFEYEINNLINSDNCSIVPNIVFKIYVDMLNKYSKIDQTKIKKYPYNLSLVSILRIPHFYINNFYVYKYAIGQIIGLYAAYKIFNKDQKFLKKYFKFLQSGTSLSPIETIKLLDIDLTKNIIYQEITKIIQELIDIYATAIKKIKKEL